MTFRQSLTKKSTLLRRWYHPSLTHIVYRSGENDEKPGQSSLSQPQFGCSKTILSQFSNRSGNGGVGSLGGLFGRSQHLYASAFTQSCGLSSFRYMSTGIGEGSDNVEQLGVDADIFSEKTMEVVTSQVPALNEVAVAAADSAFPVAALQYLIDGVHSFTGLNWWASIAVTTVLIRGATLPFLISQLKATYKLNLLRPRMEEIKQKLQGSGMDPIAVAEGQKEINALLQKYGVGPFTPLKGLLIQGPIFISFFFAITNMAEKVPSFKTGGALWFTDLTTPDSLYIFPVLASLSFLITVECNVQEGMEGSPIAGNMKNFSRIIAIFAVPFTMGFPKALFCYWITSNLFSLSYGLVIKHPDIRKLLDLPGAPTSPASTSQSALSSVSSFLQQDMDKAPAESPNTSKVAARRASPNAIMKQRTRILEQQLKARKKNKKL